jgi:uncharacterized Zn finger protein (UPF0148 family)
MPLLTCPQCGSAVTALTTETTPLRCPVCGAALSLATDAEAQEPIEAVIREHDSVSGERSGEEDDSATRAVANERMEPLIAQVRTDHQLRQGASQGVDEVTHALPDVPNAIGAAAALVAAEPAAPAWPSGREATQALPISALPPAPPEPQQRAMTARLRSLSITLLALTLVAVIVVAALTGNGVFGGMFAATTTPSATIAPAATSTPSVNAFDLRGLYRLNYPQGWTTQQRNSAPQSYYALLTAPSGGASVNIEAQRAVNAPAPAELDQQFIRALAQPGTRLAVSGAPSSVTVGGQVWTQLTADVTLQPASGQPTFYAHVAALSTQRGAYVYTIVCVATAPSLAAAGPAYTTAERAYFQPLLASFSFLS